MIDKLRVWLDNRKNIDADIYSPVRKDVVNEDWNPQPVFDLQSLTPWTDNDGVWFYSPTAGVSAQITALNEPDLGFGPNSTSIMGATNWQSVYQAFLTYPVITMSDPVWTYHQGFVGTAPNPYYVVVDTGSPNPITVDMPNTMDGAPFDVTATYVPAVSSDSATVNANVDVAAFLAMTLQSSSASTNPSFGLNYNMCPFGLDRSGDDGATTVCPAVIAYGTGPGVNVLHETMSSPIPRSRRPGSDAWDQEVVVSTRRRDGQFHATPTS